MMNAKQRRGYLSRMRNDQAASMCPECKRKTRHYTIPSKEGSEGQCDVVCEWCGKTVKAGVEGVKPYIPYRLFLTQEEHE